MRTGNGYLPVAEATCYCWNMWSSREPQRLTVRNGSFRWWAFDANHQRILLCSTRTERIILWLSAKAPAVFLMETSPARSKKSLPEAARTRISIEGNYLTVEVIIITTGLLSTSKQIVRLSIRQPFLEWKNHKFSIATNIFIVWYGISWSHLTKPRQSLSVLPVL